MRARRFASNRITNNTSPWLAGDLAREPCYNDQGSLWLGIPWGVQEGHLQMQMLVTTENSVGVHHEADRPTWHISSRRCGDRQVSGKKATRLRSLHAAFISRRRETGVICTVHYRS